MTRILVQRGSAGSSSNTNRASLPGSSSASVPQPITHQIPSAVKEEEQEKDVQDPGTSDDLLDCCGSSDDKIPRSDEFLPESTQAVRNETALDESVEKEKVGNEDVVDLEVMTKELGGVRIPEGFDTDENEVSGAGCSQIITGSSYPPPPPVPPPKPLSGSLSSRRTGSGGSNNVRIGSSRRAVAWPVVSTRSSPSGSRPSSPRSYGEGEGYNSADEQSPCFGSSYDDAEKERDHFSQFITEGFTSYCKRKRRDKVYGNNMEIQALSEMYNRPIHIYSYSTEPINIFHGSYNTDTPPIRLSYHHGNHYNSLVDPRRLNIGAGLGFSSLQGTNVDRDQVKAAIRAQQDQQIDNALLAEGRFYSDLELTEKEIERMVMEASRAEYLADDKFKQQLGYRESSTSGAEPSSSGATTGPSQSGGGRDGDLTDSMVLSSSMQMLLSMGFSYIQVIEAYSIFGDDVDSMVCYLLETGGNGAAAGSLNRRKGKAAEGETKTWL
ncbi:OVARIAN TUMOR DOMAIN-containing deubiquitinating enzyme 6 isoform X3 [Magnolia sinica]|uniref:OVARIAN TUMOR DOMAIN-containing deubiquitinating enzyme 6 isoform X3 n=1 Tax=Magnolia sinica TaxID=86752 RepID=UPI00265B223A|nr:OVARIAN TUMOR DOMAIN-containing deubiquitinating enzyme 6 isoform X3 [Magnolia sinica]